MDMVAIPAYQSSLINGAPDLKFFIRAGESIVPTGGNVEDMTENMVIEDAPQSIEVSKPKRKLSAWNRYTKKKSNKIFFKSGKNKGKLNFKAMSQAFKKSRRKK
tara:strand:+ start:435 stop:746 length:312 start_codon:yes stop_codon:yes gene_type:complete